MRAGSTHKHCPKLLVLQTHPIQYYAPIYRALAERGRVEIKVLYLTDAGAMAHHDPGFGQQVTWDIPLLEGYDYRILQPGMEITDSNFWQRHDSGLSRILAEERPDWIMIYGYASRMNWTALSWARKHEASIAYTSDSNIRDVRAGWKTAIKQHLLRRFFSQVDCFFSPSDANRDYLIHFGADATRIQFMPFAIDVKRFAAARDITRPQKFDFIWAGKLIERKRPQDFILALALLSARGMLDIKACIVGTGPMMNELKCAAESSLPEDMLVWRGFVNQGDMPLALCQAKTLVFTSEKEPYGLIATEAAACGLAIIAAENIGCVGRLTSAQPTVNALTYRAGDVHELANCMETQLKDPVRLKSLQEASLEISAEHDVSRAASIIEDAISREKPEHA